MALVRRAVETGRGDLGAHRGAGAARRALRIYAAMFLVAFAVVSLAVVVFSPVVARSEILRDAERHATSVATGLVAPLADEGFRARDQGSLARMDRALGSRMRDGSFTDAKIWVDAGDGHGTVMWASSKRVVGKTFPLDGPVYALFGTDGVVAEVSDLSDGLEPSHPPDGSLVEVYTGVIGAGGQAMIFEAYQPGASLTAAAHQLAWEILPLPLTALVLLTALTLPAAMYLALQVDRSEAKVRRLLVDAVDASDVERRRIARELHDGVLQDLAAVGYSLSSTARHLHHDQDAQAQLAEAAQILTRDVTALRRLMSDIYPPDLTDAGLRKAVEDLAAALPDGMRATVSVDAAPDPPALIARLAFRVIREALANVAQHSRAQSVTILIHQDDTHLHLRVTDDGIGFDPVSGEPAGHFGLSLAHRNVLDAEGTFQIDSAPGGGTIVTASLPL